MVRRCLIMTNAGREGPGGSFGIAATRNAPVAGLRVTEDGRTMDMTDGQGDGRRPDNPSDSPSVGAADDTASRWISLAELAELRGISRASASKLVGRNRWQRQTDDQGQVLILVPEDALMRPAGRPQGSSRDSSADASDSQTTDVDVIHALIDALGEAHARETAVLREHAEAAERRADRAEQAMAETRARAERLSETLDTTRAVLATTERRAEQLREALDLTQAVLTAAEKRAQEAEDATAVLRGVSTSLRQAEAERKARGLLARLRGAWRAE